MQIAAVGSNNALDWGIPTAGYRLQPVQACHQLRSCGYPCCLGQFCSRHTDSGGFAFCICMYIGFATCSDECQQEGKQRLPGMDAALYVKPKTWGDLKHFRERLDFLCTQDLKKGLY